MQPLRPAPLETLPSYLSRLAASKGVRIADFALDLGGSFKRFLRCDPQAIEALAGWAGLSHHGTEELLSWTGAPVGEVRMAYRGETVISRALRNPIVQGCPECLRDDAMSNPDEPLAAMVVRGDWQMREVSVCRRHGKLLVPLWTEDLPVARFDIQARLSRILDPIMAEEMDGAPIQPSPFDIWLDDRLEGKADPTWMASHSTSASAAFCRMIGQGLLNPAPDGDQIRWRYEAAAAGFAVVKDGPDAIKSIVVGLSTQSSSVADPVQQVLGQTIYALETHLLDDVSFDIFRTILRDAVLEVWAIAAGETVLGATLNERKRHSVLSASAELSIHADRLRPMLVEAGALAADDPRHDARATFDAETFADLLQEIPRFITKKAMCEVLGATSAELDGLEAAGVLRPRTFVPGARRRWLAADAEALLDELRILAGRATDGWGGGGWTTILKAQARRGVSVEKVIAGIRVGEIQLRQTNPGVGYRSFQIAVDSLSSMQNGAEQDRNPRGSSLAEFGRSIGIREADRLRALVEAGELKATAELHPTTRRRQWRVMESEMTAFRDRFLTLSMIENEFHLPRQTAETLLRQTGMAAYINSGADFGKIFLRAEVEPIPAVRLDKPL